ncbi:phage tail sheath subtilisin-like domain-containing protein [Crassaminicella profunda]|uniref:phage tail sheath subtilisin-like domain-containing protein n=1 Tax=Crassaminicella profunda TaxID=1286698 RepID=UPI001CA6E1B8|nr:phage tail sheath family protein [Crassaminicella profunda]QZY54479.1 phage tail sheath family protein [Crassaminicella profunda]
MPEYLSPGVYVEEFESGSRPMEGVSTSTAGFIGLAEKGPVKGTPVLVTNVADFKRKFGGLLSKNEFEEYRYLAYAVEHFFLNGGSRCYVMRVAPKSAKLAKNFTDETENETILKIYAKDPGVWGNNVKVKFVPSSKARTQVYEVVEDELAGNQYLVKSSVGFNAGDVVVFNDGSDKYYNRVIKSQDNILMFEKPFEVDVVDKNLAPIKTVSTCEFDMEVVYEDVKETYENVSLNQTAANFIGNKLSKSDLVTIEFVGANSEEIISPYGMIAGEEDKESHIIALMKGSNGSIGDISAADFIGEDNGPGKRTGIASFLENSQVSIMAIPGIVDLNVQLSLVAHCENLGSRFAILDVPRESKKVDDILAHRDIFDSHYAAMYHPWLTVFDPLEKVNTNIPPSGSIAGIYARTDQERGVHKAPANEVIRGCVGLDCLYNKGEQDILNPKGVNLIRNFPGQGIRVWGARTCSSNSLWKYVNVRRLFIFLEESIKANTNWVVFEPNSTALWTRVKRTIEVFLTGVWRNGALEGNAASEAFFVDIGPSTMTRDDIDNGRLICVIGVAPVKPAEFVIFRITQKTASE